MSMLSAQCDELRETAELVEGHGKVGFGDLIITDPLMVDAAKELRDAADTIWSLRCDCVELREQLNLVLESKCFAEHRLSELFSENAKLRELCADMWAGMCSDFPTSCHECEHWNANYADTFGNCEFLVRLVELGVEV